MTGAAFIHPVTIAIGGGTGSGKSTIAKMLASRWGDIGVTMIEQDHYYQDLSLVPPEEIQSRNFDHPSSLDMDLLHAHIRELQRGRGIERPTYDFKSRSRKIPVRLEAKPIVLYDGIFGCMGKHMRSLFEILLFVDTSDDVRLGRRILRDVNERGRKVDAIIAQFFGSVKPMHEQFVAPSRKNADLVINWDDHNERAIEAVGDLVRWRYEQRVKQRSP